MQPFEFDEADFAELDIITLSESEYSNAQEDVKLGYIQTTIYAFLDKNKEKIAPLLMSKLGEKALRSLHSDSAVEKLAGTIHSLLPFAIKLVLKEEVVVNFSKRNRTVLIQKLSEIESLRPLLINSK